MKLFEKEFNEVKQTVEEHKDTLVGTAIIGVAFLTGVFVGDVKGQLKVLGNMARNSVQVIRM